MAGFDNTRQHLLAEMERVDLLLRSQVIDARALSAADSRFQGLYISEEELDRLLQQPMGAPAWARAGGGVPPRDALRRLEQVNAARVAESLGRGVPLRLPRLADLCGLDAFDVDCLLISLAPELDLRYERIYAYLHDDVTRKRPSIDLVLSLLSPSIEAKLAGRDRFAGEAPLVRYRLLELFDDSTHGHSPLLARHLRIDDRIASYLLGADGLDARIGPYTSLVTPTLDLDRLWLDVDLRDRLRTFMHTGGSREPRVLYLQGPYGTGKRSVGDALCREVGRSLLVVDVEHMVGAGEGSLSTALTLVHREALLQDGVLFFKGVDDLFGDGKKPLLDQFQRNLSSWRGPILLSGNVAWEPADTLHDLPFLRADMPRPPSRRQAELWAAALGGSPGPRDLIDVDALAAKFRFTGGQIRDAVGTARNLARWRDGDSDPVTMADLYHACRLHSNQQLRSLARKITPRRRWSDIVLPPARLEQLRDICHHVRYRDRVFGDWGFDRKLSSGKGLSVLFAGPSGTGKTMAAEIIAAELALDLYRIDLSMVVSKFIGETEKNLSRVFAEAESSNAILLFDEADALFGRRSEVRDAHDRYANIEIGYLLQQMEAYEGVVILATNLRKNMDEAFVRRLHFTVEFPFPSAVERRRIWEAVWPRETPLDDGLDFDLLARHFEITGGHVRNIAVAAAFLAAHDGQRVTMDHLMRATHRELHKMGKIVAEGAFERQQDVTLQP